MSLSRRHFIGALTATGGAVALSGAVQAIAPAIRPRAVIHVADRISPFILLDNVGMTLPTNSTVGLAAHPQRGFETVTMLMGGEVEHGDSIANRGVIASGDVPWMTAARGIVHEENPSAAFRKSGGRMVGVQL